MTTERWRYDPGSGDVVRYAVSLDRGVLTATSPYDERKAVAADESEADQWFRWWGMQASRADAARAGLLAMMTAHEESARRLDVARAAWLRESGERREPGDRRGERGGL